MGIKRILGIICVVIGIYLIATATSSMDTVGEKVTKEFSGDYTHHTRNNMIGGIVLIVLGGALFFMRRPKP